MIVLPVTVYPIYVSALTDINVFVYGNLFKLLVFYVLLCFEFIPSPVVIALCLGFQSYTLASSFSFNWCLSQVNSVFRLIVVACLLGIHINSLLLTKLLIISPSFGYLVVMVLSFLLSSALLVI